MNQSTITTATDNVRRRRGNAFDRWLRRRLLARLTGLKRAGLTIRDPEGVTFLGQPGAELQAEVSVHDLHFWRLMATGGSVGAAEAYMAGLWDTPDPVAVVQVLARNRHVMPELERGGARVSNALLGLWHAHNRNSLNGSRRNISAHYDLGNEFFSAWLDEHMMYSSALFLDAEESLEQAQLNKLDRICQKLDLAPEDHLLEIGSGWGGLAIHAARHYGCRVTTTTISREQFEYAREAVARAGLADRVEVLMRDYRDLDGEYDKLVSVEMIEAVGHQYLDTYMGAIDRLLRPGGLALIQAITIEDSRYRSALSNIDFIKRYIFPGSFIPSVSAISGAMARSSRLGLIELADFGNSYALTLARWRQRFESAWDRISEMGFDESFRRRWRWYLAYCEGGFRERAISDVHLLLAGPDWRASSAAGLTGGS
ncbi:class I SAM-dependent methyltransferase [Wenzhouxiangella sp. AB-CW3]|uniref:SAM-dependent methyltransferase n=1 Tax=Wenzhouxiangella sp. AB-CW3 TaxID=2771012 RepID=UPI00168B96DE|nr:cyclopropane-fatty-acyl-phospholipid synthase family protein [Wenzhouxiangella sp. AB-CW3]QOC23343.1 class I SAM-dependent methyltransferase [Wenzhouxiangella sp. AB-CW3]